MLQNMGKIDMRRGEVIEEKRPAVDNYPARRESSTLGEAPCGLSAPSHGAEVTTPSPKAPPLLDQEGSYHR